MTTGLVIACLSTRRLSRLDFCVSLTETMRYLFLCTLLVILPIAVLAQSKRPLRQLRQARPDLSTNAVRDWTNRVMSSDAKIRATSEAALVHEAQRSLPLLRRFLNSDDEDLHQETRLCCDLSS